MQNDHVKIPNTKWQPNQMFRADKKVCRMVDPRRTDYARPSELLKLAWPQTPAVGSMLHQILRIEI